MIEHPMPEPPLDPPTWPYVCDFQFCSEEFYNDPLTSKLDTSLQFCCAECRYDWELDQKEKQCREHRKPSRNSFGSHDSKHTISNASKP